MIQIRKQKITIWGPCMAQVQQELSMIDDKNTLKLDFTAINHNYRPARSELVIRDNYHSDRVKGKLKLTPIFTPRSKLIELMDANMDLDTPNLKRIVEETKKEPKRKLLYKIN